MHANLPKCDHCFFDRSGCYIEGNRLYAEWYDSEGYDRGEWPRGELANLTNSVPRCLAAIHVAAETASEIMAQRNVRESDLPKYVKDYCKGDVGSKEPEVRQAATPSPATGRVASGSSAKPRPRPVGKAAEGKAVATPRVVTPVAGSSSRPNRAFVLVSCQC